MPSQGRRPIVARAELARADPIERESGVLVLIEQMIEMLRAEEPGQTSDPAAGTSMGRSATQHGRDLQQRGTGRRRKPCSAAGLRSAVERQLTAR